jgi:hypothetical protein
MARRCAYSHPEFGAWSGWGGRRLRGRISRLQGAARRYAASLRPALDPRASPAPTGRLVGQAGGLPTAARAHPTPAVARFRGRLR